MHFMLHYSRIQAITVNVNFWDSLIEFSSKFPSNLFLKKNYMCSNAFPYNMTLKRTWIKTKWTDIDIGRSSWPGPVLPRAGVLADNQLLTWLNADVNLNLVTHSGKSSNNVNANTRRPRWPHKPTAWRISISKRAKAVVGGVSRPH